MIVRAAIPADAEAIARLVNDAYRVERFFVEGDRTNAEDVRSLLSAGAFLVVVPDADAEIAGCVFIEVAGETAHFGMLAVNGAAQGRGMGRRLILAAESHAHAAGARAMEIRVVNLRAELFPYYRRLGYDDTGDTEPYVHRPVIRACHFVVLRKALIGDSARGPGCAIL